MANQDKNPAVGTHAGGAGEAGGTATQPRSQFGSADAPQSSGFAGGEADELARELRQTTRRDVWMTLNVVMLGVGAGWSATQIGSFYGINATLCANAIDAYRQGKLSAVRSLNLKW